MSMNMIALASLADWTAIAAAVGVAVSLVMQLVKPLLETIPVFDPANARAYRDEAHNAILRIVAGVLTYAGVLLIAVQYQPLSSQLAVAVLGLAFPGSFAAFGSFKGGQYLQTKLAASSAPPTVPPMPANAQQVPTTSSPTPGAPGVA